MSSNLNLDELHNALFYMNRAVIKILVSENNISLDEAEQFLISALSESVVKEFNTLATSETKINATKILKSLNQNNQN